VVGEEDLEQVIANRLNIGESRLKKILYFFIEEFYVLIKLK